MNEPASLLILGLGNILCQDDGLGVAAVLELLEKYEVPPGVAVLDGGTLGLSLLPHLEDAEMAILVDAIWTTEPPGSPVRLQGAEVGPAVRERLSVHQIGVADLLDGARLRGRAPRSLILLGLVPESLELGLGRSAAVQRNMTALVARIITEARELGFRFRRKREYETPTARDLLHAAGVVGV
jgi:hydrogenase maturation protease